MTERNAIAIAAHPDDIEYMMAGTLCLLKKAGWRIHYLNVATGSGGSVVHRAAALRKIRRREGQEAAAILGAEFHESLVDDLEIVYSVPLLRRMAAIVRAVRPAIVLTHSPQDYMEDHMNTCRLAVTAAFARGIPNFKAGRAAAWSGDTTVYHAMPVGLCDGLRRRIVPGAFVNTESVQKQKRAALACHQSQQNWLQVSQGTNSYLQQMEDIALAVGRMSKRFRVAEGWRRHAHQGFSATDADPLAAALGKNHFVNRAYERGLKKG
jgi:LmbE family N-acetylglucosaminyl deacetylase